jgi:hypothetical protein
METLYKTELGTWEVSRWENGQISFTAEDGHTYTKFSDGSIAHMFCHCFHQ